MKPYFEDDIEADMIAEFWQEEFESGCIADKLQAVNNEAELILQDERGQSIEEYVAHMAVFVENLPYGEQIIKKLIKDRKGV